MFTKAILSLLLVSTALASPVVLSAPSFNSWGGFSSLDGFDNFYGSSNFDGSHNSQVIVIQQENEVVCQSVGIEIIQQRLAILQEVAKRIITEQICEDVTRTVVFEQFQSSFSHFSHDISHQNGRLPGFDSHISGLYNSIFGSDGSLSSNDLGFSGQDIGQSSIIPSGTNWNDATSPGLILSAKNAAKQAVKAAKGSNSATATAPPAQSSVATTTAAPASSSTSA